MNFAHAEYDKVSKRLQKTMDDWPQYFKETHSEFMYSLRHQHRFHTERVDRSHKRLWMAQIDQNAQL